MNDLHTPFYLGFGGVSPFSFTRFFKSRGDDRVLLVDKENGQKKCSVSVSWSNSSELKKLVLLRFHDFPPIFYRDTQLSLSDTFVKVNTVFS